MSWNLPMLQNGPVHPLVHWQEYDPALFIHVAPLKHGLCRHSLTSENVGNILQIEHN
jgi:hypothetical protein